jgi:hypothetical protein
MTQSLTLPESALLIPRQFGVIDDFLSFSDADLWTIIDADSGATVLPSDAAGGILNLTTGATDNNEAYVATTQELYLFADDKPLLFLARLQWVEANTNDANVIAGLMDAVAANHLIDDAGGPVASYSGAVFFKAKDSLLWQFETSLSGTQTTTTLAAASPNGAADFHSLKIEARRRDATTVEIIPYIDEAGGQDYKQALDANGAKVKHTITLGSPTEMSAMCGVKAGGANSEVVAVDYLGAHQLR